ARSRSSRACGPRRDPRERALHRAPRRLPLPRSAGRAPRPRDAAPRRWVLRAESCPCDWSAARSAVRAQACRWSASGRGRRRARPSFALELGLALLAECRARFLIVFRAVQRGDREQLLAHAVADFVDPALVDELLRNRERD